MSKELAALSALRKRLKGLDSEVRKREANLDSINRQFFAASNNFSASAAKRRQMISDLDRKRADAEREFTKLVAEKTQLLDEIERKTAEKNFELEEIESMQDERNSIISFVRTGIEEIGNVVRNFEKLHDSKVSLVKDLSDKAVKEGEDCIKSFSSFDGAMLNEKKDKLNAIKSGFLNSFRGYRKELDALVNGMGEEKDYSVREVDEELLHEELEKIYSVKGINVGNDVFARMISNGKQKMIVSDKNYRELVSADRLALVSGNRAYGFIKVFEAKPITLREFSSMRHAHRMNESVRKEMYPDAQKLFAYPIKSFFSFREPVFIRHAGKDFVTKVITYEDFIKNIDKYDPEKTDSKVLADDFRIVMAWYSSIKSGKNLPHTLKQVVITAKEIYREMRKRGFRFNREKMKPSSQELFDIITRGINDPENKQGKGMRENSAFFPIHKGSSSDRGTKIHIDKILKSWKPATLQREALMFSEGDDGAINFFRNFDEKDLSELCEWRLKRGRPREAHKMFFSDSPLAGMEGIADLFMTRKKYDLHEMSRKDFQGDIDDDDTFSSSKMRPIKLCEDYVTLVGSLANWGETDGDVDMVVKADEDSELFQRTKSYILQSFKDIADRIHVLPAGKWKGPFTNHIHLADLLLIPNNFAKDYASEFFVSAREKSKVENKIIPLRPFWQAKPIHGRTRTMHYSIDELVDITNKVWSEWENIGIYVGIKRDGITTQWHYSDGKVKAWTEDGLEIDGRLEQLTKEFAELGKKFGSLVLIGEIEYYPEGHHATRSTTAGIVNSGQKQEEERDLRLTVYDVFFIGNKDIHEEPYEKRNKVMISIPDSGHIRIAKPEYLVNSVEKLKGAVEKLANTPGSEGAMLKLADKPYKLSYHQSPAAMIKFKKERMLTGIVIRRNEAGAAFNYDMKLKDAPYAGKTYNTAVKLEPGDHAKIAFVDITGYKDPKTGQRWVNWWAPHVIGKTDEEASSVSEAFKMAEETTGIVDKSRGIPKGGLPQHPETAKGFSNQRTQDVPVQRRFVIQHHWRGKSVHADFRYQVSDKWLNGFTIAEQAKGIVTEPVISLDEAKEIESGKISKVDWSTGEEKKRTTESGDARQKIFCAQKPNQPVDWLKIEGSTYRKDLGEGSLPGSTKNYPGIFLILDRGTFEMGADKPHFKEFFMHGQKIRGRIVFRIVSGLKGSKSELSWLYWKPDDQAPYVLSSRAVSENWFPDKGHALPSEWIDKIPTEFRWWKFPKEKWSELRRAARKALLKSNDLSKITFEEESKIIAKNKKLPAAQKQHKFIEAQWTHKNGHPRCMLCGDEPRIPRNGETPDAHGYGACDGLSKDNSTHFLLTRRYWQGPIVKRGAAIEDFHLKIGGKQFHLNKSPENSQAISVVEFSGSPQFFRPGEYKPGTAVNPNKKIMAKVEKIDEGAVKIFSGEGKGEFTIQLSGKVVKGMWAFNNSPGSKIWSMKFRSKEFSAVRDVFVPFRDRDYKKIESLIGDVKLPYRFPCTVFAPGIWNGTEYTEENLRNSPKLDGTVLVVDHQDGFFTRIGKVIEGGWNEETKTVEAICETIDKEAALRIANKLVSGISPRVQGDYYMGADGVERTNYVEGWPHVAVVDDPACDKSWVHY